MSQSGCVGRFSRDDKLCRKNNKIAKPAVTKSFPIGRSTATALNFVMHFPSTYASEAREAPLRLGASIPN